MLGSPRIAMQRRRIVAAFGMTSAAQREVDTSSSPALPAYGADETPAWQENRVVPQWAREEYVAEAALTLIASVSEGKIGSVYFPEGRIRTTHRGGPLESSHKGSSTLQFNVDNTAATQEFEAQNPGIWHEVEEEVAMRWGAIPPKEFKSRCSQTYARRRNRWLADRLAAATMKSLPSWAVAVTSPATAVDLASETPREGAALFEIFVSVSGQVEGWHPSRGVAARFATDKQVVSVLKAALAQLEVDKITDPAERNVAFYNFIKSRLPVFVSNIRAPEQIARRF
ncbi:MAG: hypothetical protein JNN03_11670 [Rubrivivax sp.]|nr:hypothetical protein [Rubrivivax sp.]